MSISAEQLFKVSVYLFYSKGTCIYPQRDVARKLEVDSCVKGPKESKVFWERQVVASKTRLGSCSGFCAMKSYTCPSDFIGDPVGPPGKHPREHLLCLVTTGLPSLITPDSKTSAGISLISHPTNFIRKWGQERISGKTWTPFARKPQTECRQSGKSPGLGSVSLSATLRALMLLWPAGRILSNEL